MKNQISITKKSTKTLVNKRTAIINKDCSDVVKSINAKYRNRIITYNPYGIIVNGLNIMLTETKKLLSIIFLLWLFASACTKESPAPVSMGSLAELFKARHNNNGWHGTGNSGNHYGNRSSYTDSASAMQPYYEFPPLVSDTLRFPTLQYLTGAFCTYDSTLSIFTILSSGNYDINVTAYRDTPNAEPTNLLLYLNSTLIFDTGWPIATGSISLQQSITCSAGDMVYVRTMDPYHTVLPGGNFTIYKN